MNYNKSFYNNESSSSSSSSSLASISNDDQNDHKFLTTPPSTSVTSRTTTINAEYQPNNNQQQTVAAGQGKRIVDTLWELELDSILGDQQHTEAVHQLIVALIVIALISIVLISTVLLFRCYMLYCQNYPNVRRYQLPPTSSELQPMQQAFGLPTVPAPLVPRHRRQSHRIFVDEVVRKQLAAIGQSLASNFPQKARIHAHLSEPEVGECYPNCDDQI